MVVTLALAGEGNKAASEVLELRSEVHRQALMMLYN